ncbi:MAG: hypothetical protein OXG58_03825 [Gemmatimonadetes bacterium]|nr:hypothetical protein [Gemmatimonadota bacterium]MCY3942705.1 hypothetical protein [Gemmatimonadota bacterium]
MALLLPPLAGVAQEETRGPWGAYLGCWSSLAAGEEEGNLCFVADGADVEMLTVVDGAVLHREPFIADGVRREIARSGCRGTESNLFSDDGRRLYTSSETACAGEPLRRSTGVISMIGTDEWIDVRAIEANGVATPWSRRYERTGYGPLVEAGLVAEETALLFGPGVAVPRVRGVTVDEILDAVGNVDAVAVQGWLAEAEERVADLDAEGLVRLEEAGVPGAVIDIAVAVTFPEHFALRDDRRDRGGSRHGYWGGWRAPYHRYSSYYGPWGYRRYGYWGYGGYYTPVVVTVAPNTDRAKGGRIVAGKGYRAPRGTAASSGGKQVRRAPTNDSGSGSKSGSRRGSTGRKAKPRGGK